MRGEEKLYVPLGPVKDRPTMQVQLADRDSLYYEVKELIAFRQAHPALKSRGGIEFIYAEKDAYLFVYVRSREEERIFVVLDPFDTPVSLTGSCFLGGGRKKGQPASLPGAFRAFGGEIMEKDGTLTVLAGFYQV